MDYLDPEKQRRHSILLIIGYALMAIAIVFATVILVYQAYGFGLDKNGSVIQNGIVFFSSQPNPAQIYVNGKLSKASTNARLTLPANTYNISLARTGYQDWQRTISVEGGSVSHFDYPLLLPKIVKTSAVASLPAAPTLTTQSPDRRWLLLSFASDAANLQLFDLKNPAKPAESLALPADLVTKATANEQWQQATWADDNLHILLQRSVDGKTEFILVDRANPDQSLNLNRTLGADPTVITLSDRKYDQYYLFNSGDHSLQTASLKAPAPVNYLSNVLAYKSYQSDQMLYFTSADAPAGKVYLKLQVGDRNILLRTFPVSAQYLVDLATYSNTPYIVASATADNKVYIFKDPLNQLAQRPNQVIVPLQVLRVPGADYESFSSNAQFIVVEHGSQLAVYDLENKNGYNFVQKAGLDNPQTHVSWLDGNRFDYVSGGKLQILDYDQQNQRSFTDASAASGAFMAPDFKKVYTIVISPSAVNLQVTALLIPADQ